VVFKAITGMMLKRKKIKNEVRIKHGPPAPLESALPTEPSQATLKVRARTGDLSTYGKEVAKYNSVLQENC
jgi:hypothetical protein